MKTASEAHTPPNARPSLLCLARAKVARQAPLAAHMAIVVNRQSRPPDLIGHMDESKKNSFLPIN